MTFEQGLRTVTASLQVGFFLLMGLGLVIGTFLLWFGKIEGSDWTLLCSVLFSADRASHAVSQWGKNDG